MNHQQAQTPVRIQVISAAQTIPLRLEVLRPGRPAETTHFPGDDHPATRHWGVFQQEKLVGIASLFFEKFPPRPKMRAYQLRGMAVAPAAQSNGLGTYLLQACIDYVRGTGAAILWCNARTSASAFYRKHGFEIIGQEFQIPDVGPHFRMVLTL